MERRLDRLARRLPPVAGRRLDLSALTDDELEELVWFAWYARTGDDGAIDLSRLTSAQRARITALAMKAGRVAALERKRQGAPS